ncbi:MAG: sulfatase [Acidobacteriota bacterium]|nr:sulfatase [Blastocatellia bacterium]MDW8239081.1 sulfatase [Acidobacteriota bacterium]
MGLNGKTTGAFPEPTTPSFFDYVFIGCGAGFLLTLVEAFDLHRSVAPFFTTNQERWRFLAYLSPTVISMTLMGALVGVTLTAWAAFRRWENQISPTDIAKRWLSAGLRMILFGIGAAAMAIVLRPTFMAVGRRVSALMKDRVQSLFPDGFEYAKSVFHWMQAHPLIILCVVLVLVGLAIRWVLRRRALQTVRLSLAQRLVVALILGALTVGIYSVDSRYFFSLYDRSVHLPLFLLQLGLSFLTVALLYFTFGRIERQRQRRWATIGIFLTLGLACWALVQLSDDPSLRALFWSRSVLARRTLVLLQSVTDFDRDGFAAILGGGDCDNRNAARHPLAPEIPNNGLDDNCLGGDLNLTDQGLGIKTNESAVAGRKTTHNSRLTTHEPRATSHDPRATTHEPRITDRGSRPTNYEPRTTPATILLITIDALRADHLGCYGYTRPTSPHLDRFTQHGQQFVYAYAQGTNTGHSFASMLRSAYGEDIFDEDRPTFVELLAAHGYQTISFSAKRMQKWLRGKTWARYKPTLLKGMNVHAHEDQLGQWSADEITDALIDYFNSPDSAGLQFIWAHYLEPHYPYRRYTEFDFGSSRLDRYDSEIAYTDRALGRLFQYFDQTQRWRNTLVIISSDHGEAFFEHGQQEHSSRPYQEQIRVPLLMRYPGLLPARFEQPVGLIDIGPTVLRFAGIAVPSAYEGIDLASPSLNEPRIIISETPRNIPEPNFYVWAMIQGSWKLMYDIVSNTFELYHLAEDPQERRNLIASHPTKASEMITTFGRWFDWQSTRPIHSGDWNLKRMLKKPR